MDPGKRYPITGVMPRDTTKLCSELEFHKTMVALLDTLSMNYHMSRPLQNIED